MLLHMSDYVVYSRLSYMMNSSQQPVVGNGSL